MSDAVTMDVRGEIAVITIDDGKANALSGEVIANLNEALDRVDVDGSGIKAVIIAGRDGMLSGGFDLQVMRGGDWRAITALVTDGGDLVLRLFRSKCPVVCACTGHAIAAGALLALGSHYRVGAEGPYRIGLIETAIGMVLPDWAVIIAEERLCRTQTQQAIVEARVYGPADAKDAGFLDRVVPADTVMTAAMEEATRLAALPPDAYAGNALKVRGPAIARLTDAVARDRQRSS